MGCEHCGKQEGMGGRIVLKVPDGHFCRLNRQVVGNYIL